MTDFLNCALAEKTSLAEANTPKKSRNGRTNRWSGLTAKAIVMDLVRFPAMCFYNELPSHRSVLTCTSSGGERSSTSCSKCWNAAKLQRKMEWQ